MIRPAVPSFVLRAIAQVRRAHPALRWGAGGGAASLLVWAVVATVFTFTSIQGLTPEVAQAAGVYLTSTTDADGNAQLAANSVTNSYTYNLDDASTDGTGDSSEAVQQQVGTDPNWRNGVTRSSSAVKFDGTNDYIDTPVEFANGATSFTVEAWVNPAASQNSYADIIGNHSDSQVGFVIEQNAASTNTYQAYLGGGGSWTITPNFSLTANTWQHVAIVKTVTTLKAYVNGEEVASAASAVAYATSGTGLRLGRGYLGGGGGTAASRSFSGTLDEVRISTMARYTAAFAPPRRLIEDAGTLELYHLDEGTSTTATDSSGNANTGTLTNGPVWTTGSQSITDGFKGCSPDDAVDAGCQVGGRTGSGNLRLGSNSSATDRKTYEVQMVDGRSGLSFDGTNDYVDAGNSAALQLNTGTAEAWIKASGSNSSYRGIIAKHNAYSLFLKNDVLMLYSWGGSVGDKTTAISITDGAWHHIAVTFDSGVTNGTKIWYDGALVLTTTMTVAGQGSTFAIGLGTPGSQYFYGTIDEVRVSNTLRYTAAFTPERRFSADGITAGLWHLDEGTGTTAADSSGSNTGTLWNTPTWVTGLPSAFNGATPYYQYRYSGGSWSTAVAASATSTQLGSTGIYLSFNIKGKYSLYEKFTIASWAVEAFSTSSPQRGTRRSFPNRTHLITSASGLDIIDASTNKLWMRAPVASGNDWFRATPKGAVMKNGILYLGKSSFGLTRVDFSMDRGFYVHSDACYNIGNSTTGLAVRTVTGYTSGGCDYEVPGSEVYQIAPQVISGVQYFAAAGTGGVYLYNELTHQQNYYRKIGGANYYAGVVLTPGGRLYAANTSGGGLDIWTAVQSDTTDQTGADVSYTTSSTPALSSNTVNALAVTSGTSTVESGSNTLAIGTSLGTNVIDEHSTQASSVVRNYVREGSVGTSGYNQKNFGGALSFDQVDDNVSAGNNSLIQLSSGTIEAWVYNIAGGAGAIIAKYNAYGVYARSCTFQVYDWNATGWHDSGVNACDSTWHHVALTFTSGVAGGTKLWIDGALALTTVQTVYNQSSNLMIGSDAGNNLLSGKIDEVRLSDNIRYTAAFTPQTTPFATDSNTMTLYHFNELNGQVIYDSSSSANNGTLGVSSSVSTDDPIRIIPAIAGSSDKVTAVGLTPTTDPGRAVSFDGGDFVAITGSGGSGSSLNITGTALSLAAWVKFGNATAAWQCIICKQDSGVGQYSFMTNSTTGQLGLTLNRSGWAQITSSGTVLKSNTWYHLAVVYDGATATFYINGVQDASVAATGSISYDSSTVRLGWANSAMLASGSQLDDVRIYNVSLAAADIKRLYGFGSGTSLPINSGLKGWYRVNETSGQSVLDSSGNANNGTLGADGSSSTDDPTRTTDSPYGQSSALWIATNGAGADDGAVTEVASLPIPSQQKVYLTTNSNLPDQDITSLSMDSGGLAFIGTETGGWSTGTGGAPELTNGVRQGAMHIRGATRITGATRISR